MTTNTYHVIKTVHVGLAWILEWEDEMRRNNRHRGSDMQGPGRFNVQSYVDVRDLATVAEWMMRNGYVTRAQSGSVMKACLELVLEDLRNSSEEFYEFELVSEAVQWMDSRGFSMAQMNYRKGLIKDLADEAYMQDFGQAPPLRATLNRASTSTFEGLVDRKKMEIRDPSTGTVLADASTFELMESIRRRKEEEEREAKLKEDAIALGNTMPNVVED